MSHFQWHFFIDFLDFFHKNFIWGALSNVLTILEIAYILTESQGMIYTLPMAIMLFYWSVRTLNKKFHERFLCVISCEQEYEKDYKEKESLKHVRIKPLEEKFINATSTKWINLH